MSHENYLLEAQQHAILVSLDTTTPMAARDRLIAEAAYRRGFYQGAFARQENQSLPKDQLERWMDDLYDWRLKRHEGYFEEPPQPGPVRG